MPGLSRESLDEAVAIDRLRLLFGKIPTGVVSALIGIFLLFVLLLGVLDTEAARAGAAYMLAVVGYRAWLWYRFQSAALDASATRRWEYALALSALLMGLGWAQLSLALSPSLGIYPQFMILTAMIIVAVAGTTIFGLSHKAFWAVTGPTLLPAFYRFHETATANGVLPLYSIILCVANFALVAMLQASYRATLMENLRRRIESEALLDEQQAIFHSATLGIAVVERGRVLKANARLGEMLEGRISELLELPIESNLASPD